MEMMKNGSTEKNKSENKKPTEPNRHPNNNNDIRLESSRMRYEPEIKYAYTTW